MTRSRRTATGMAAPATGMVDAETRGSPGRRLRPSTPPLVSPALVLLAAAAFLEAYQALDVLPASHETSGVVFAMLAAPLTVLLTRPPAGEHRGWGGGGVVGSAMLVVATTVVALAVDRPAAVTARGASDLVLAFLALGTAFAGEIRRARMAEPSFDDMVVDRGLPDGRPVGIRLEKVHDEGLEPDSEERPLLILSVGPRRTDDPS